MLRRLDTGDPVEVLPLLFSEERSGPSRPWIMYNMVCSVDGATAVDGSATPLNDPDDKELFGALRAVADVILVGAETVRSENYGPSRLDEKRREARRDRGMVEAPTLAIATRSGNLDPEARVFSDPSHRPVVVTGPEADRERVAALEQVADVHVLEDLAPESIVSHLDEFGIILCEGGPNLNGQFYAAGLVDEINLTIAPQVVSGDSARIAHGELADPPLQMRLDRTLRGDASLFLRYLRD